MTRAVADLTTSFKVLFLKRLMVILHAQSVRLDVGAVNCLQLLKVDE
jgi:hypothetical protein